MTNDASKVSESVQKIRDNTMDSLAMRLDRQYRIMRDHERVDLTKGEMDTVLRMYREMHRLRASHERLERDAARYRWLREFRSPVSFEPFIAVHGAGGFSQWVGEGADAAVDAAQGPRHE